MESIRGLLSQGNGKLGQYISHFDLPAVLTCPGRTSLCEKHCYARSGRFHFQAVKDKLEWNYQQSLSDDFVPRMVAEIKQKGVLVLRLHSSGDVFSVEYALKWLQIMKQCPRVRFYGYTRSWRNPEIAAVLKKMAALKCCRLWFSSDSESGAPSSIPSGVRVAYMKVSQDEKPTKHDLLFVIRKLKRTSASLPLLCPQQAGREDNCGSCGRCFQ